MTWWTTLPVFWKGFICGGFSVPAAIVLIELVIKFFIRGESSSE